MKDCTIHPKKTRRNDIIFQESCLKQEEIIFDIFSHLEDSSRETVCFFYYIVHEAPRSNQSSVSDEDFVIGLIEDAKQVIELKTRFSISESQENIVKEILEKFFLPNRKFIHEISGHFVHKACKKELEDEILYETSILTETKNLHPNGDSIDLAQLGETISLFECKLNLTGFDNSSKADKQLNLLETLAKILEDFNLTSEIGVADFSLRDKNVSIQSLDKKPDFTYTLYDFYQK